MQSAASQQFLNHEKLPHFFFIFPQEPLFLPQAVWGGASSAVLMLAMGQAGSRGATR